jgi:hypothetical protein|tara:strand:- start:87 stop:299 length:213 start_codon:yes stop_codon:yes gene_type:complete
LQFLECQQERGADKSPRNYLRNYWRPIRRLATQDLITQLHHETNVHYLNFSGFVSVTGPVRTPRKAALAA